MYLTCDLPAPPLYPDEMRENIIPQVPIFGILNKFNGLVEKEYKTYKDSTLKRFEITQLPPYIILYIKVLLDTLRFVLCFHVFLFEPKHVASAHTRCLPPPVKVSSNPSYSLVFIIILLLYQALLICSSTYKSYRLNSVYAEN